MATKKTTASASDDQSVAPEAQTENATAAINADPALPSGQDSAIPKDGEIAEAPPKVASLPASRTPAEAKAMGLDPSAYGKV